MKNSLVFKILILLGTLIICLFLSTSFLIYQNDKALIKQIQSQNSENALVALDKRLQSELELNKKQMENTIDIIGKNSSLFLLNYNIEALKKSLIFDIKPELIKSIIIYDSIINEIFLVATKQNNKVQFTTTIGNNLNQYGKIEDTIFILEDGKKNPIGKITLYYDENLIINKITKIKEQTKLNIEKFDYQIDNKVEQFFKIKLIIFVGLLITILFVSSILLIKYVNTPLKKLKNGLDDFFLFLQSKKEHLDEIKINTHDEFGIMAKSLNENIQVSAQLHKQIKELNTNLEQKIAIRTNELEKARQKAEDATKSKSLFLANMSHEIRTPMNAIISMLYFISQTKLSKEQKNLTEKINNASHSLLNIINDILDFSKIEAGKMEIEEINFNLDTLLQNVSNIVELKVQEKALSYEVQKTTANNIYFGDPLRIQQILINLINNAIKFTDKGSVQITVEETSNSKIRFNVKDTGIGIKNKQLKKLFKSFSQADESTTRKYGGTGLGLTISKQLVELMNGKIAVDSKEGFGSLFYFEIPLAKADVTKLNTTITKKNLAELKQEVTKLRGSTILLVEDNEINREIINRFLSFSGINIDEAVNGQIAVQMYKNNPGKYSLILMDIQMPVMDGFEATKKIQELDKNIPIIALTASVMKQDLLKTKNAGMKAHLNKPIELNKLFEVFLEFIPKQVKEPLLLKTEQKRKLEETEQLNAIDIKAGLNYFMNDSSFYYSVLDDFYIKYKTLNLNTINDKEIFKIVHTIKALSLSIGAQKLYEITVTLNQNQNKNLITKFQQELNKTLFEIKTILDNKGKQ